MARAVTKSEAEEEDVRDAKLGFKTREAPGSVCYRGWKFLSLPASGKSAGSALVVIRVIMTLCPIGFRKPDSFLPQTTFPGV